MNSIFSKLEQYSTLKNAISHERYPILISGLGDMAKTLIIKDICENFNKKAIVVTHQRNREDLLKRLKNQFEKIYSIQERDNPLLPFKAKGKESSIKRIEEIIKIKNSYDIVVLTPQNLIEKYPQYDFKYITLNVGDTIDFNDFIKKLIDFGYENVQTVYEKGQFSKRGGILDIFPILCDSPVRVEFFGDEIDTIKIFDVESQKSYEKIDNVTIYQVTEWEQQKVQEKIDEFLKDYNKVYSKLSKEYKNNLNETFKEVLEGTDYKEESLYPYYYNKLYTIFDIFKDAIIFIDEYPRIIDSMEGFEKQFEETFFDLLEKGYALPKQAELYFKSSYIIEMLQEKSIVLTTFIQGLRFLKPKEIISFVLREIPSFNGNKELLLSDVKFLDSHNYAINIFCGSQTAVDELSNFLENNGLYVYPSSDISLTKGVYLLPYSLEKGIEISQIGLSLLSFLNIELHKRDKKQAKHKSKKEAFYTLEDLKEGTLVVHHSHGIGKFIGFEKVEIEGITKEYIKLEYANNSFLYVPTTNLDSIEKYIGSEDTVPKLSKLGTNDWQKQKQKVKKSLEIIAKDIIELYAKRQLKKGYKFSNDTIWQKEFEEKFPYQETEGQLNAIEEIKRDMESDKAMDRILCGDVGYGKTEVALRAAFKAVMDSKQVAFLVPTTVLAHQHYMNFLERLKEFPVKVEVLSRFKSEGEQKEIIKAISNGMIDIIIGTHRLLSKDVKFKDLGLLIIDEEHRFGVEHKEKIKKLKENVDVLTLTATPIPRTLNMAMLGIKELSVIEEPPEDRFPVQTFVMEYNEKIIKEAILKEVQRGGQVFYLYNRVQGIDGVVDKLQRLVGEDIKIAYAHGQMDDDKLEEVLVDFMNGNYDVLVCTTIIESGVDIPNANTLIVEDADKLGLAQLYQIRGRVGRANKIAYAYLTFRKDRVLSEEAQKRLSAIKEFTEFGSGFKIAMRDLEIRGAGSILGKVQHGHINAVGYDMYIRLLSEEIKRLKGEQIVEEFTPQIDIKISAFIDKNYIYDDGERINMYKKISSIKTKDDMDQIYDELIDRFADIPIEVDNLIKIAYIKALCQNNGIISITQKENIARLQFINEEMLKNFVDINKDINFVPIKDENTILIKWPNMDILNNLIKILEESKQNAYC
ncbi:transcription-repair coupling factor [Caldicellulosiruptoraceae bacterium PP1]